MRKNKAMRTASFLLIATLLTTSVISGVFAKYTTKAEGSDVARVAQWGVVATVSDSIFGTKYGQTDSKPEIHSTDTAYSVVSSDTSSVVAPGTKNVDFKYNVTGTPEVDGVIDVLLTGKNISLRALEYSKMTEVENSSEAEFDAGNYYYKDSASTPGYPKYRATTGSYNASETYYTKEVIVDLSGTGGYYPVVFTLADGTTTTGINADSLSVIAAKLLTSKTFTANTNLDTMVSLPDISWEWKFCNNPASEGGPCEGYKIKEVIPGSGSYDYTSACKYCLADTLLGDLIAGKKGTNPAIDLDTYVSTGYNDGSPFYGPAVNQSNLDLDFSLKIAVTQTD